MLYRFPNIDLYLMVMLSQTVEFVDEPTNHLDMESIESLNTGLEKFPGTLVFISHDREFVSSRSRVTARSSTIWVAMKIIWPAWGSTDYCGMPAAARVRISRTQSTSDWW